MGQEVSQRRETGDDDPGNSRIVVDCMVMNKHVVSERRGNMPRVQSGISEFECVRKTMYGKSVMSSAVPAQR